MGKNIFGRKFKRDVNERTALFKGLASSLVLQERITTTEAKAKAIKGYVEKLVTKAKKADVRQAHRLLQPYLSAMATQKMLSDIAPRFTTRAGGYTRIIKVRHRLKDNAQMAFIEWVERSSPLRSASFEGQAKVAKVGTKRPIRQAQGKQSKKGKKGETK